MFIIKENGIFGMSIEWIINLLLVERKQKTQKQQDKIEEEVKKLNRDLSFVKMKSLFAVTFTMILFVGLLNSLYVLINYYHLFYCR